jgi:ABC-type uncharacterized transport system permease subunit
VYGFIVIGLYFVAAVLVAWGAWRARDGAAAARGAGPWLAALAVLAHVGWLSTTIRAEAGYALDIADSLSLFGLVVGAIGALLAFRPGFRAPAAILLATAAALSLGTGSVSTIREVTDPGWPLAAHITLSALAFGLMATAALLALVLAAQEANLRSRRPAQWLAALPPMESMEHAVFTLLTLGFIALSVTLLVGAFFVTDLFGQRLVHKVTLALVAWGIFGVLLLGRYRFGWRGRKARRLVLAGFGMLAMSYLLTKFILEVLLGRHWG